MWTKATFEALRQGKVVRNVEPAPYGMDSTDFSQKNLPAGNFGAIVELTRWHVGVVFRQDLGTFWYNEEEYGELEVWIVEEEE